MAGLVVNNQSSEVLSPKCSSAVAQLLMEIEGQAVRPQPKSKPLPKDHTKENIRRLKDIQAKSKKKEDEKKKPVKVTWKTDKYSHVSSKVTTSAKTPVSYAQPALSVFKLPTESQRLSGSNSDDSEKNSPDASPTDTVRKQPTEMRGPFNLQGTLQKSVSTGELYEDNKKMTKNTSGQGTQTSLLSSTSASELIKMRDKPSKGIDTHRLGAVPKYLIERKKQWKEEEERKRQEKDNLSIPAGYTLLDEEERQETLHLLKKNQAEILLKLASLPVRSDTLRLRQRKEELEKQLMKVEEGIRIFSRPKVLIKDDA